MARINSDSRSQQNRLQKSRKQPSKCFDRQFIPQLEVLEARVVPTTVILTPSKDNTLYESTTGDTSNGAGANFFVGVTNKASIRRGVIEFNIAGNIPAGATINSVSLSLHVSQTQAGAETIELHRLLADWGESTSNADGSGGGGRGAPAASNDATWLFRFFNTSRWTNAGGDFTSTISASASVGGVGSYTWGSTTQLVADVQSWLNTPSNNFGWILLGDETTQQSAKRFDSKENATAANRPTLTIDYTAGTQGATSTTVTSSANPSVFSQAVTLTATVTAVAPATGTPTGTVTFRDGTTTLGTATLNNGTATFTTSALTTGSHSLMVVYGGDSNFAGSTSATLTQTVNQASSTTTVASSVNPSVFGQAVTFTATVTAVAPGAGTPTGTITFRDGTTTLGTATLNNGTATLSTSALAVAGHAITAVYSGDTNFTTSTSATLTQTVNQASSTTTVTSSINPSVFGQSVTFTATVSAAAPGAGTPTGTVTFRDGATTLGTATLSGGTATFTTAALAVASHAITAVYAGDTNFTTSTSATLTQTVNRASSTTSLTSSVNPSGLGQAVTFTATVAAVAPGAGTATGTVTFNDGSTTLGSGTLNANGIATFTTSSLAVGSHALTAVYAGDSNFTTSTSSTLTQTVTGASSTTVITASANPAVFGQAVTLTATVTAVAPATGTPTGTVTFRDGSTTLGTGTLNASGVATLTTSGLSVGPHTLTAVYGGDSNFAGSTSATLTQTVNQASSTTTVASSVNPSVFGQAVTFTATVSAVAPGSGTTTGTVTFRDGTTTLGTATLSNGTATLATSALNVGSHAITVVYAGDTNFTTSTSATLTQTVNQASSTTTVTSSVNPSVFGQGVTFTATVTAVAPGTGTPSGTVTFRDGTTTLGTATLSGGSATFTTAALAVAGHAITAVYAGDTNFTTSTSATLTQTVNQASTTTTVTSSVNPSALGQAVTFTATVSAVAPGAGTPTGNVTFRDGSTSLGTVTLNNGTATFTTSTLAAGSHAITVVYGGDTNFATSTSATLTQTVSQSNNSATTVISSANPAVFGQTVTFTATVTAVAPATGTPTGTVTFRDGTTTLGTGTLNASGVATFSTTTLSVGTHTITGVYGGDSNFAGSTSATLTQTVNQASSTTTVASSVNPSVFGQAVTFTATVSAVAPGAGTPTGTVTFRDGTTTLGTVTLSGGSASFTTSALAVAGHAITAVYAGDTNFTTSTSATLTQTVNQASTTTTVTSSVNPSALGQAVTFTATVSAVAPGAGTPTGNVTFRDGSTSLGTVTLNNGTATFTTSTLAAGSHAITVVYGGDTNFATSTSATLTQTVNQANSSATSVTSSVNPSALGQAVTLTATVNAVTPGTGTPTGTVTFRDGSTTLGTATLSNGTATFSTTALTTGSHAITVAYSGDGNFAGSTSATLTQTVNPASSTTTVASSVNPSSSGQVVTFTATVNAVAPGAGTPTGTVTFRDGSTNLGTSTLSGNTATFTTSALAVGSHTITAVYAGDTNFTGSTSASLTQTVNQTSSTGFQQRNLVSNLANPPGGAPIVVDTNLKNPWGISFSSASPFWIADQRTGLSSVYRGDVTQADGTISPITIARAPVTIPPAAGGPQGSPTGTVFNSTNDFILANGNPAVFIFDGLDGTITAWNTGDVNQAELKVSVPGAVYTGLALGTSSSGANFLYAANQSTGKIDVFDKNFQLTTLGPGGNFEDPNLPPGSPFKAFNIQNLGGTLYVTYDKVTALDREHDGIVDAFDTDGNFLRRVVTGGVNAPWGLALAPANFGPYGNDLLVGNFGFGDGKISIYNPTTGQFLGNLSDGNGNPFVIEGLWALAFGNGGNGGDRNTLYFTAGINRTGPGSFGAADGLFGSIRFVSPKGSLGGSDGSSGGIGPNILRGRDATLLAPLLAGATTPMSASSANSASARPVEPVDVTGVDQLFAALADGIQVESFTEQIHGFRRSADGFLDLWQEDLGLSSEIEF